MITYTVKNDENEYVLEDASDKQLSTDDYSELIKLAERIGKDYLYNQNEREDNYPINITIIQDGQELGSYSVCMIHAESIFIVNENEIDEF